LSPRLRSARSFAGVPSLSDKLPNNKLRSGNRPEDPARIHVDKFAYHHDLKMRRM
jgi:hypothetical protein